MTGAGVFGCRTPRSWAAPVVGHGPPAMSSGCGSGIAVRGASSGCCPHLDHISHEARLAQVRAVEEETSQYPAGVPQVLAGDFNSRPSNPVAGVLVGAGWVDAFVEANGEDAEHMSFHRFEGDAYKPKKGTPGRIDHIFPERHGYPGRLLRICKRLCRRQVSQRPLFLGGYRDRIAVAKGRIAYASAANPWLVQWLPAVVVPGWFGRMTSLSRNETPAARSDSGSCCPGLFGRMAAVVPESNIPGS